MSGNSSLFYDRLFHTNLRKGKAVLCLGTFNSVYSAVFYIGKLSHVRDPLGRTGPFRVCGALEDVWGSFRVYGAL